MPSSVKDHWNKIYASKPVTQLGWHEVEPHPSLDLIERCAGSKDAAILDVGSGMSTLIPYLLKLGYKSLYAVDIGDVALEKAKGRLEEEKQVYHSVLQRLVMPDGFVILATFAPDGAAKCSGLPVQRYSADHLREFMGETFRLVESLNYLYRYAIG